MLFRLAQHGRLGHIGIMATDQQHTTAQVPPSQGSAISPSLRRRLQSWYTHGQEKFAAGSLDYAIDLFSQCVEGDPASLDYLNAFLQTVYKKYNNNKRGAGFTSAIKSSALKASLKRSAIKKDWPALFKTGLDLLKLNPWDIGTLVQMAHACEAMRCPETELAWLRAALDVQPNDAEINRQCAVALTRQGHFDQAIVCWSRVQKARPQDEEPLKSISDLQVRKTELQLVRRTEQEAAAKVAAAETDDDDATKPTRQQKLQQTIADNPADLDSYIELAELHARHDRYNEAERILRGAMEASGGELKVREAYEDMALRRARHQVQIAEQRAAKDGSDESESLAIRMRQELNRQETEVFRARAERYPNVVSWKIELGTRLKRGGNFGEAIKVLQPATADPRRRAFVHVELGECFQQIQQYRLAMGNYEAALEALAERGEPELKKKALYRAGVLAMGLEDLNLAEKYLTELAGMEYGYRDVAERLDKLAEIRHKG
jgi:tetratricopeptide (TPR) repeat protein